MAILRQRQRNLLLASLLGSILTLIIVILIYLFTLRDNGPALAWLHLNEIEANQVEEEVIEKGSVYTIIQPLEKGEFLDASSLMRMEIESRYIPANAIQDISGIENHIAAIMIADNTILTKDMFIQNTVTDDFTHAYELNDIHIPDFIEADSFAQLRIRFPSGQDYILLDNVLVSTINEERNIATLNLQPKDMLILSSAQADMRLYPLTQVYVIAYKNNMITQRSSQNTYPLNPNVIGLVTRYPDENPMTEIELIHLRQQLDIALEEFYDEDAIAYDYEFTESVISFVENENGDFEESDNTYTYEGDMDLKDDKGESAEDNYEGDDTIGKLDSEFVEPSSNVDREDLASAQSSNKNTEALNNPSYIDTATSNDSRVESQETGEDTYTEYDNQNSTTEDEDEAFNF